MKKHFLKDLLDAASSSRSHFPKPRKSSRTMATDPDSTTNASMRSRKGPYGGSGLKAKILARFWRSRVGQPWNEIWSEVVEAFGKQPDLLRQVEMIVGVGRKSQKGDNICPLRCWVYGGRRGQNIDSFENHIVFYVCPKTGCLTVLSRPEFHRRYGTAGDQVPLPSDWPMSPGAK